MFAMHGPVPQEILALRESRNSVLERLVVHAWSLLDDLVRRLDVNAFCRIARWIRIAICLQMRIDDGALDDGPRPRQTRPLQAPKPAEPPELRVERERPERLLEADDAAVRDYLSRPFGEVVAIICKGIGMTPDWGAWAPEPWAQEEIRTQLPGSPYAGYAGEASEAAQSLEPPPRRQPPAAPRALRPAALPGAPPPTRKARRALAARALKRSA
jgi:hypothetical protein